jgi:hypothetical protein
MKRVVVRVLVLAAALGACAGVVAARLAWDGGGAASGPEPRASLAWTAASLFGFALLVGGTVQLGRGLDRTSERVLGRDASGAGALIAAGLVLFLLGLYKA